MVSEESEREEDEEGRCVASMTVACKLQEKMEDGPAVIVCVMSSWQEG